MDRVMGSRPLGTPARARLSWRRLAMVLLLLFGAIASAHAQFGGSHGRGQKNQQQTPQQSPTPPEPPAVPEIWPRLEDGALICKSRDDLVRYQAQIADGANGAAAGQAPDCHTIRKQTGIQILARDGPSRTQIVTTDESKETGWTNSYLSQKALVPGNEVTGFVRSRRRNPAAAPGSDEQARDSGKSHCLPGEAGTYASATPQSSSSCSDSPRDIGSVRLTHGPRPAPG
jgi:hypothetical protein